LLKTTVDTHFI